MPLTWNVGEIADWKTVTTSPDTRDKEDQKWHPVTHALIMHSMTLGYGHISEKNYKEIALRWAQYQHACGEVLGYQLMEKVYITEEDVRMHIGLRTNVGWISKAKWHAHLLKIITSECRTKLDGYSNKVLAPDEFKREGDEKVEGVSAYEIVQRVADFYKPREKVDG